MYTIAHLSYCGFNFDHATKDVDRRDVELMLQQRNQGLRPNIDYMFQPMQTGWQISGITPLGARAVCVVAQALKRIPNRLDMTLTVEDTNFSEDSDYNSVVGKLIGWFNVNRPKINISHMLPLSGDRKILFGSKNSRWCLWVAERVKPGDIPGREALEITWTTRNENCKAAWEFYVGCGSDKDFETMSKEAFAACTNTILGTDFFDLGLSDKAYLRKDKPGSEQKDWLSYLAAVSKKMVKHYSDDFNGSIDGDIAFIKKETGRLLDKVEQQV